MNNIDFGRHSEDYAAYRPGLPASFYQRLDAIIPIREARSLDLATGPGTIALELGAHGSSVVGICNGVGSGGLPPSEVQRFDNALSRLLSNRYPDPMVVEHRVWCVVARKPS